MIKLGNFLCEPKDLSRSMYLPHLNPRNSAARSDDGLYPQENKTIVLKDKSTSLIHNFESWSAGLPPQGLIVAPAPDKIPTILAIGGGKGGVGKSILSANLAAKLGQVGFRVLLVDLDIGSANLHTYFGLPIPQRTLADYVLFQQCSFEDVLCNTPNKNVYLLAGGKDEAWSDASDFGAGAFSNLWASLLNAQVKQGIDFIILDLGAGTHRHTIDFFISAHLGVVTVIPEPTSIENAYSFLKASLWRIVENVGVSTNSCAAADEIKEHIFNPYSRFTNSGSHLSRLKSLGPEYSDITKQIFKALKGRQVGFVVNQIRSQKDIDIGESMQTISRNFFGFDTRFLGYMNYDDAAWKSLRNKRLLVADFPHCILSKKISEVTSRILRSLGYL